MNQNVKIVEITLIQVSDEDNSILGSIVSSINTYLLKNRGIASDFNLIKDIVERNCDSSDEEINTLLPIPLYLGLMGTMLGIIAGLGFMIITGFDKFFEFSDGNNGIGILMSGVGLAMISSFMGLLFTVIASGIFYKGAKTHVESLKNSFFSFIQTDLLPIVSQNVASGMYALQANLMKFNDKFERNIGDFNHVLSQILTSFNSQVELMHELKRINVAELATANITVLRELRTSTKEFEKFNVYLQQVNSFVENATRLNVQISNQLDRTQSIELVAATIGRNVDLNNKMMEVLQSDIREIDTRKQYISAAVINVDDAIQKGLEGLKEHTLAKLNAIKDITIKEEDLLEKLLKEDRGNLSELKKLSAVKESLEKMESSTKLQNLKLDTLNDSINKLSDSIRNQKQDSLQIPVPVKYLGYAFLGTGTLIGLSFIGLKLYSWILPLL